MTESRAQDRLLFEAGEAAGMIGGACRGELSAPITNVVIDSRKCRAGSLFVALPGEHADGHEYIADALARGASCIMAENGRWARTPGTQVGESIGNSAVILVDSTLSGLQTLAREHRRRMRNLVRIGVTGSSGKTTTKECIGAALSAAYPEGTVAVAEGNLNSDIGLPLAVFALNQTHRLAVFELGMNRRGEMGELASVYEPDMALITNVGTAHIGMIGSRQGIAEEKKLIFSKFDGPQKGFVWEDDEFADFLAFGVRGSMHRFGLRSTPGFESAENLGLHGWNISWNGQRFRFPLAGTHNLLNALAALSVAGQFDLDPCLVAKGLSSVKPLFGRSELFLGKISLYRDCYNANPDSVRSVLDLCDSFEWPGRKIYVLGSMRELGENSADAHAAMGARAADSSADLLLFFGEEAKDAYRAAALSKRDDPDRMIFHTNDLETLTNTVLGSLKPGDFLLVKASRGLELERLTEVLFDKGWAERNQGVDHAS